jgi:hypothetical protein
VQSYEEGRIEIIEDYSHYTVTVKIIDTTGVPEYIDDLQRVLRKIIPAHIVLAFEFNYLTWDELDTMNITWDNLDAEAMTWDELEAWV